MKWSYTEHSSMFFDKACMAINILGDFSMRSTGDSGTSYRGGAASRLPFVSEENVSSQWVKNCLPNQMASKSCTKLQQKHQDSAAEVSKEDALKFDEKIDRLLCRFGLVFWIVGREI